MGLRRRPEESPGGDVKLVPVIPESLIDREREDGGFLNLGSPRERTMTPYSRMRPPERGFGMRGKAERCETVSDRRAA